MLKSGLSFTDLDLLIRLMVRGNGEIPKPMMEKRSAP